MVNTGQPSVFSRTYNSFSGVDIKATFGSVVIGELQAISFSITREKAPIYTMGSAEMRSVSRGKRGIAGTLIFIMLDRDPLLTAMRGMLFQSDRDDVWPDYTSTDGSLAIQLRGGDASLGLGGQVGGAQAEQELTTVASDQIAASPWYLDQIPAFDVVLAAANEYGALATMQILGVEILNQGYGTSIDDVVSEQQCTYLARAVRPWAWQSPVFPNNVT